MSISEGAPIRAALAAALALAASALPGCTHLLYHPTDWMYVRNPRALDGIRQEVSFPSTDGTKLSGWFLPARSGGHRGTVIQFHGNAQNLTSHFQALFWLTNEGYDLFVFDYRGYGISEGVPSEEGLNRDALAAIRYVEARVPAPGDGKPDLVLYGQSLGGAVLARAMDDVSAREKARVRTVVIESSFESYRSVAAAVLSQRWFTWWLQPLAYLLVSDAFSPERSFARIAPIPVIVIHGDADPIVPFHFGERIFELAGAPKAILRVPGGGHIDAAMVDSGKYRRNILELLDSAGNERLLRYQAGGSLAGNDSQEASSTVSRAR